MVMLDGSSEMFSPCDSWNSLDVLDFLPNGLNLRILKPKSKKEKKWKDFFGYCVLRVFCFLENKNDFPCYQNCVYFFSLCVLFQKKIPLFPVNSLIFIGNIKTLKLSPVHLFRDKTYHFYKLSLKTVG